MASAKRSRTRSRPAAAALTRRELLRRLGLLAAAIYAPPHVLVIADAHASKGSGGGSGGGDGGGSGESSGGNSGQGRVDDDDGGEDGDDSDARQAVKEGAAAPLAQILANVREKYRGDVARVRLRKSGKTLVYVVRIIDAENRVVDVRVDARTGRIIGASGV